MIQLALIWLLWWGLMGWLTYYGDQEHWWS